MGATKRQAFYDIRVDSVGELATVHVAECFDGAVAYCVASKQYFTLDMTSALPASASVIEPLAGSPIAGGRDARWILQEALAPEPTPLAPGEFASFFALMPGDNAATVAVGAAVEFPQDGPTSTPSGITRLSASTFNIEEPGIYEVDFQVSVSEAGQLMLDLDGALIANSVAGRATGTSQISNHVYITVATPNSVLRVINPPGNAAALTITPVAGGTHSVSAWLTVRKAD